MRVITSSLRNQLLAGFGLVTAVFAIGAVVAIISLASLSAALMAGAKRIVLA
jgi:hypothetical protein